MMRVSSEDALTRLVKFLSRAKQAQLEPVVPEHAQTALADPLSRLEALMKQAQRLDAPLSLATLMERALLDDAFDVAQGLDWSGEPAPLVALTRELKREIAQVGGVRALARLGASRSASSSQPTPPPARVQEKIAPAPKAASAQADAALGASMVLWRVLGQRSLSGASRAQAAALLSEVLAEGEDDRVARALYLLVHDQEP